ncbi:efflux RND transporter periplasmic adaptor subunit [Paenibacillus sp. LHD-117]|uniref:efflux RND transporter periplasmic adaptor subunit n=1 Tax=Paenibacillus sp. LHD-117 TaxID=3071412 RepID=UPI0027DFFABC|nr:efflux RND transporter periplasmic adaptor subunit [Paenibacillus sp. LHD-117]MDQ6422386.1 efflux RND transporter periplasmic adaptor subunit [Paenibacillus sp. LHD-117]
MMFMKWPTADWVRRSGRPAIALACLTVMLVAAGCSLAPESQGAELIELIEPPKLSKKPEFTVAKADIETKVSATGKLMSSAQEELRFGGESGQIAELKVEAGDTVKKGQVIAILATGTLETQLKRKNIEVRQAELSMIEKLRDDSRTPTQKELDELNFELLVSERDELAAKLEASKLVAPFDGTIVSLAKEAGDMVNAYESVGQIADLTKLVVAVDFAASDLEKIAPGMEAKVQINTAGSFDGKVLRMPLSSGSSDQGESLDGYVLIELDEFPKEVKSGTPLSAAVVTERKKDVVLIPPAALRSASNRHYVQVVDAEGNKREVDVEVGLSTSTEVEIVKGLEPGQKVIGK